MSAWEPKSLKLEIRLSAPDFLNGVVLRVLVNLFSERSCSLDLSALSAVIGNIFARPSARGGVGGIKVPFSAAHMILM